MEKGCFIIPIETEGGPAHPEKGRTLTDSWWQKEVSDDDLSLCGVQDNDDEYFQLQFHKVAAQGERFLGGFGAYLGSMVQGEYRRLVKGQHVTDPYRVVWAKSSPWWCLASSSDKGQVLRAFSWLMEAVRPALAAVSDDDIGGREGIVLRMVMARVAEECDTELLPVLGSINMEHNIDALVERFSEEDSQMVRQMIKHRIVSVALDKIAECRSNSDIDHVYDDFSKRFGAAAGDLNLYETCLDRFVVRQRQMLGKDLVSLTQQYERTIQQQAARIRELESQLQNQQRQSDTETMVSIDGPPVPPPPPKPTSLPTVNIVVAKPKEASTKTVESNVAPARPDFLQDLFSRIKSRREAVARDEDNFE